MPQKVHQCHKTDPELSPVAVPEYKSKARRLFSSSLFLDFDLLVTRHSTLTSSYFITLSALVSTFSDIDNPICLAVVFTIAERDFLENPHFILRFSRI
jgi:hypothetical protein